MPRRNVSLSDLLEEIEDGSTDFRELDSEETVPVSQLRKRKLKKKKHRAAVAKLVADPRELVTSGTFDDPHIRQAGADLSDTEQIDEFRREAESSLYVLAKAVLRKWWLYAPLHVPLCNKLSDFSAGFRHKMDLWPREHGKTTVICDTLPLHLFIQPKDNNIYFPNMDGLHTRVYMCCEKIGKAKDHVRVLQGELEGNTLFRSLWPHVVWPGRPRKHTNVWNAEEFLLPRSQDFPDPSVRGCGVDAAITGGHPNVLIKDDLIGFPRCTSMVEMQATLEWHKASRNLVRGQPQHLEWTIGTHWTPADIYVNIGLDSSVEVTRLSAIENGEVIYPVQGNKEDGSQIGFTIEDLRREEKENPVLFQLNYMNNPVAREIVDFPRDALRFLALDGDELIFEEDERDIQLMNQGEAHTPLADETGRFMAGVPFTPEVQAAFYSSLTQGARVRFR